MVYNTSIEQPRQCRHEDSEVPCRQKASVLIYVIRMIKHQTLNVCDAFLIFCKVVNIIVKRSLQLGYSHRELRGTVPQDRTLALLLLSTGTSH